MTVEFSYPWTSPETRFLCLGVVRDHRTFMAWLELIASADEVATAAVRTRIETAAHVLATGSPLGPLLQYATGQVDAQQVVEALQLAQSRTFLWGPRHEHV